MLGFVDNCAYEFIMNLKQILYSYVYFIRRNNYGMG